MILLFWTCVAILMYTFLGYGVLLFALVKVKRLFTRKTNNADRNYYPTCSVLIAAYNEELYIRQKIVNTRALNYPPNQLSIFVIADGSTDRTMEIAAEFPDVVLLYNRERKGKVHAINRAMHSISSEIVVFTDANTFLNKDALIKISSNYQDKSVGGVAGEKRVFKDKFSDASSSGESLYWKYESFLKKMDSELNTTIGAAGELFSIRRDLYEHVPLGIILDDFIISMQIAQKGFKIVYEPSAYAIESSSASITEELKRKIRIAAGGFQSIIHLKGLLNPTKNPLLSFQYISHRVLRWTLAPFLLLLAMISNIYLFIHSDEIIYLLSGSFQLLFYLLASLGYILDRRNIKSKISFVPLYFCIMNYAVLRGLWDFINGRQNGIWVKAERKDISEIQSFKM